MGRPASRKARSSSARGGSSENQVRSRRSSAADRGPRAAISLNRSASVAQPTKAIMPQLDDAHHRAQADARVRQELRLEQLLHGLEAQLCNVIRREGPQAAPDADGGCAFDQPRVGYGA